MSAASERSRNNVRAGLFVAASLTIALAVFFTLQKLSFEQRTTYQIRFSVEAGVAGLSPGGEVRIGGLKRGEVLAINPHYEDGALRALDVDIAISSSITVYRNAKVLRVAPLLGNTAWINFVTVGTPRETNAAGASVEVATVPAGDRIEAIDAPGMLTSIVGEKSAEQIVTIIDRATTFSEVLERVPSDYDGTIVPALDAARDTIVELRADYGRWRLKVDEALTSATDAAANLERATDGATALVADAHAVLRDNRPRIDNTLINVESASANARDAIDDIRTKTLPQVSDLLTQGERALVEFADALDRLDKEVAERLPDIRSFLSDARVAAQQLKLATIEVRRNPWRLLYRPSTEILEHEQLYEATRSFAFATGDLRSAADSIQEALKVRPHLLESDPDARDRLQRSLLDALDRYEEAQRRLFGVLTAEP